MNIEKMGEEFEEAYTDYCAEHGWKTYTAFHVLSEVYVKASTELAWNMWKASRESLVIELPERDAHELSINAMFGYDLARKDAIRAIEAAGLKVKP